jgi:hypothetical protein
MAPLTLTIHDLETLEQRTLVRVRNIVYALAEFCGAAFAGGDLTHLNSLIESFVKDMILFQSVYYLGLQSSFVGEQYGFAPPPDPTSQSSFMQSFPALLIAD